MSHIRRINKVCLVFVSIFLLHGYLLADNNKQVDSIKQIIKNLPDTARLSYLKNLVNESSTEKYYRDYIRIYNEEATRQEDRFHLENSLIRLGRYYYPDFPDSLRAVIDILKPLLIESTNYKDYVEIQGIYIYTLIREGKNEKALDAIHELKQFCIKVGYDEGIEMAEKNLGYFYFLNNMSEDAEKVYLNILGRMEKRDAPLHQQIGILVQLFSHLPDPDVRLVYLKRAEQYIERFYRNDDKRPGHEFPMYMHEYSVYWNYAAIDMINDNLDEAFQNIKKVEELVENYNMKQDRRLSVEQLYFDYYMKRGNREKALEYLDRIEKLSRNYNLLSTLIYYLDLKSGIYAEQGHYKDAYNLQKELLSLNDSINQTSFQERLADMRTKYEVEKLEMEKQQIEREAEQTRTKMMLLIGSCLLLILIIVALSYMIRESLRSKRIMQLAKEKAEEADKMKSTFLANMNHEIRTPLNAIVGFSQVLIEEENKEARQEFSDIIQNNNDLLQRLIADILDISKIESNSMSLIYTKQDLAGIMKEMYSMISIRMSPDVKLILDPCESFVFETDRNRLIQIITNLLTNAIKHTSSGHIRFGYQLQPTDILFYVEDTGEGIPDDRLDSIFGRFAQLENGKKGVGLGLAISKGLVAKMKGEIWVTSTVGKGSTFYIQLPKLQPETKS